MGMRILKKVLRVFCFILLGLGALFVVLLMVAGWYGGVGPFDSFYVSRLVDRNAEEPEGGIVFYGASNFTRWKEVSSDLAPYHIINNGFGGSDDKRLVKYADKLLFPYEPEIVFFQTGSNDYLNLQGTDEEKIRVCMDYKTKMFEGFHRKMPDAKFVVMSGLLLPGRSEFTDLTIAINEELERYCDSTGYMYFIDANDMTYDGAEFDTSLFVKDGIHLNREGQQEWASRMLPVLEELQPAE
jgi:lysophospholipase L1-like esterase